MKTVYSDKPKNGQVLQNGQMCFLRPARL